MLQTLPNFNKSAILSGFLCLSFLWIIPGTDLGASTLTKLGHLAFSSGDYSLPDLPPEICDNGLDDDGDGLTDCADSDCISSSYATVVTSQTGVVNPNNTLGAPNSVLLPSDG